jgi:hypothetical protein
MMRWLRGPLMLSALLGGMLTTWGCGGVNPGPASQAPPAGDPPGGPPQGFPLRGPRGEGPGDGGGSRIKQIMGTLSRGSNALTPVIDKELQANPPDWDTIQPQAAEYAQLTAEMGKLDPPKGSKESWAKLTAAYAESAAALDKAAQAKDQNAAKTAHRKLATSRNECHREHRGGPGGFGPGGPGGPGGGFGAFVGRPQPGELMAPFLQDVLKLTPEQKKEVEELQKEVDSELDKLLTEEQKKQLKDMQQSPGFGRPGGPPPGG